MFGLFKQTRQFDGVTYWFEGMFPNAKIANAIANSYRADGLSARVVEAVEGYKVQVTDKAGQAMSPPDQQQQNQNNQQV